MKKLYKILKCKTCNQEIKSKPNWDSIEEMNTFLEIKRLKNKGKKIRYTNGSEEIFNKGDKNE